MLLVKGALLRGKRVDVLCDGGRIARIASEVKERHEFEIDGRHKLLVPPLANMHTHAAMSLLRGVSDEGPLEPWLQRIWGIEAKLNAQDVYWGARLACLEMVKSGTLLFNDMYYHPEQTARAAERAGMRALVSMVFFDFGDAGKLAAQQREAERLLSEFPRSSRVHLAAGPHAVYTVSAEGLRWVAQLAEKHKLPVHMHLSETQAEIAGCESAFGKRPVEHAHALGLVTKRLIAAHCVHANAAEAELLRAAGSTVVHCPTSNMKLGSGMVGLERFAGANVCLGTDGPVSNNALDMFQEMKAAALLQKVQGREIAAERVLEMATANAYGLFGLDVGITEGATADFILLDARAPSLTPMHSLASNLVYAANGGMVTDAVCDGRILMTERRVPGEEEILERAAAQAAEWVSR